MESGAGHCSLRERVRLARGAVIVSDTELKGTDSWQRDGYIEKQGWATMPGAEKPDRNVAEACAKLLLASM
jgi:hypothetical protein